MTLNTTAKMIISPLLATLLIGGTACSDRSQPAAPEPVPEIADTAQEAVQDADDEAFEALFADAIVVPADNAEAAPAAPDSATAPSVDFSAPPPKYLSEYGLFEDLQNQIPNPGLLPYEVNNELFSDGARVQRFIWLPEGAQMRYSATDQFEAPVGTLLLQTFGYPRDEGQGDLLVESRIMLRQEDDWTMTAYRWDAENTNARKAVAGGIVDVPRSAGDTEQVPSKHVILNMNDCKRCHENQDEISPIGLTARNLNRTIDRENGPADQLARWVELGILADAPSDPAAHPAGVQWDDATSGRVDERARAWLDVNCAYCHNPRGAGNVSGLDLSVTQNDPIRIGIYKPPVAAGRGSEGLRFSIDPGSPETSFLVRRLQSTDPSVMMPPLGRMTAADAPAALVSEWIAGLHFDADEAEAIKAEQLEEFNRLQEQGALPGITE